jgi:AcrR family transcriptional regulator
MKYDTRRRLVDAARELFWKKGFYACSVAEILEAAGANSGSLYHFFPTKQDLLVAVLEWYVENLEGQILEPARKETSDPVEQVFAVLDGYRNGLLATELTFGCPIGNLALEFKEPDPPVRELLARNFSQWCEGIEECLRAASHRFPGDLDLAELSRFVLTTMEGGVMQARTHRSVEPYDASVRQLRRYMEALQQEANNHGPIT